MINLLQRLRAQTLLQLGSRISGTRFVQLSKTPKNVAAVRDQRLGELLHHAKNNVPFYSNRILELGKTGQSNLDRLASVPVLTKDDVERNFPDSITDQSDPADWRMMSTRGTAQRLVTVQDFAKRDANRAAQLRMLLLSNGYSIGKRKIEIPPEICEIVCGDEGEKEESVMSFAWSAIRSGSWKDKKSLRDLRGIVERQWIFNTEHYAGFGHHGSKPPADMLQRYVDRLRLGKPFVVKTLATYLVEIAKHIRDSDQQPLKIPVIKVMGSRVTPNQRCMIEKWFGGKFWDDYGSAEFGSMACECDQHDGLHVFDDMFVVEVVDDAGQPVADGVSGWILVTDLMNRAMPLIRYCIGDVGFLNSLPCDCGRTSHRLTVQGRAHDVLVTGSGSWKTHDDVVDFCESFPGVDSCVVECRSSGKFNLTVIPGRQTAFEKDEFSKAFSQWIETNSRVSVRTASTIHAEAGGKFRFVRGNLNSMRGAA